MITHKFEKKKKLPRRFKKLICNESSQQWIGQQCEISIKKLNRKESESAFYMINYKIDRFYLQSSDSRVFSHWYQFTIVFKYPLYGAWLQK